MSEVKVKIDLDLDDRLAKGQLQNFKKEAEKEKIPVRLDLDNVKGDALKLKSVLSDAFKLDSGTISNLKQIENSLKQINSLIKTQSSLVSKVSSKNNGKNDLGTISINKNTDIIKDTSVLLRDYKKAQSQLEDLDAIGKEISSLLRDFNKEQEDAYKKFAQDSKSYETYLKELQGDNITKTLKKAIEQRKKSIQLQEELAKSGVIKVNNDQLRNETADGRIFTIENEKWKAMFARSESEAKELEDLARKIQPKILNANKKVEELIKEMSEGERKLLEDVSKAFEQRPQFNRTVSTSDSTNAVGIRMYLESMMPDIDKMGLDFDSIDDLVRGLNRYYSRLEQMQNEFNSKFASESGFTPITLESLIGIDKQDINKVADDLENSADLLSKTVKNQIAEINKALSSSQIDTVALNNLLTIANSGGKVKTNSIDSIVKSYLSVSKEIDSLQTKLYKATFNEQTQTADSLRKELELLQKKRDDLAKLIDISSEYIQQEREIAQARAKTANSQLYDSTRAKAFQEEEEELKSLISQYEKYEKEYTNLVNKQDKLLSQGKSGEAEALNTQLELLEKLKNELKETNKQTFGDKLLSELEKVEDKYKEIARISRETLNGQNEDRNNARQLQEEEKQLKELIKTYEKYEKELTKLKTTQNELRYQGKDGEANALQSQIDSLEKLKQELKEVNNTSFGDRLYPELERIENKYREIARAAEELSRGRYDDAQTAQLNKAYQELDKIQNKLKEMQNTRGFLDSDLVEKINNLLAETRAKLDFNGISSDFKEIENIIQSLGNHLRDLNIGNTLNRQGTNFNTSLKKMEDRVNAFIEKCKEMGNADHLIERVEQAFRNIDTSNIERGTADLREFTNTMTQAEREARNLANSVGQGGFFANFGEEFRSNLFTFTAGELLADGIRDAGRALKDFVLEYDAAFTNLKKVANPADIMDVSQLEAIGKKANEIAKNVGQSSQDTIQAISDTIQMAGLGMEESIKVAEQTMKLANVAEMTQEAASQGVVTMLSAYNLDPMKEIPIVVDGVTKSTNEMVNSFDVLNHVGNNFAVSSDGLLDAIQSGANVLATYGVSLNDTVAMITSANTTLQDTSRVKILTSFIEI